MACVQRGWLGVPPTIVIRHDSSRQGRVAENEFANYFHGHGNFYR
jgi:hypothetical protein